MIKRLPILLFVLAGACRGQPSESQPIHLVPDMDWQPKFQAAEASDLWADGRAMRPLVAGTVPQGHLNDDEGYHTGMLTGKYLAKAPIPVDAKVLRRGQERYNIFCAPCHDKAGAGGGAAVLHGYPLPLDLTAERARGLPDGQIFWTITNGVRNMPYYRKQIPVEDRWAITAWLRVLQRSQSATLDDVPAEMRDRIELENTEAPK